MPSTSTPESDLLAANQHLLVAIAAGDWDTYAQLCDEAITCFEPEALGHLVEGLSFHKFYFDLPGGDSPRNTTISGANVRILGEVGIVCYTRLVQKLDGSGNPVTVSANETRIWRKVGSDWKHIHFHRSPC